MDAITFFDNHWFLAFLAICFVYGLLIRILRLPILLIHGWPPAHLDADGCHVYEQEKVDDK